VMKAGEIVDVLDMEMLKRGEIHSYTRELIAASPTPVG
jgi:ABC-type dipeptide/oligopeptide/nickel transport system ATPase component